MAVLSLLFTANACEEGDAFEYYDFVSDEYDYFNYYHSLDNHSNNIDVSYKHSIVPFRITARYGYAPPANQILSALPSWTIF